ncbi:hypothetical protein SAMN05216303_102827 [Rhodoferax sp. OV413]|uniref:hypothetical protein n=1 Tax=Rhodoferax sp. OV413 TaxID=1855285 RepID=UPI000883284E|nr:hypothetical protein [Rhodoferax sp. OV413]SDO97251.1 hypothetical protein SAMN05216303_102827 [Rhodoferax sp. OV413]
MTRQQATFANDQSVPTPDSAALHVTSLEVDILALLGSPLPPPKPTSQSMALDGKQFGHWSLNTQDALILQIDAAMSDSQRAELIRLTSNFIRRKVWAKPKRKSTSKTTQAGTVLQLDLFETVPAAESLPQLSSTECV